MAILSALVKYFRRAVRQQLFLFSSDSNPPTYSNFDAHTNANADRHAQCGDAALHAASEPTRSAATPLPTCTPRQRRRQPSRPRARQRLGRLRLVAANVTPQKFSSATLGEDYIILRLPAGWILGADANAVIQSSICSLVLGGNYREWPTYGACTQMDQLLQKGPAYSR